MIARKITKELTAFFERKGKEALLVSGARQVFMFFMAKNMTPNGD